MTADLLDSRPLPQDLEAERAVLGAMMLAESATVEVLDLLTARDFYNLTHGVIFDAILDLYTGGSPVDAVTVGTSLTRSGDLGRVGGLPYLHTLINGVPTVANAGFYAEIIRETAILRRLAEAGTRMVQMAYETHGSDVAAIIARAEREISAVVTAASGTAGTSVLDSVCPDLGPYLDGTYAAPEPAIGRREDGARLFYPGEVNRVFGRSESGKTWLVLLAGLQHLSKGRDFVFLDYENGPAGIVPRLLALGADPGALRSGRFRYVDLRDAVLSADMRAAIVSAHTGALVAVDSVAGLVASNARSSNAVDDVEALITRDLAILTRAGHSVVLIDHESDRSEGSGRSSGSHRKRDLISGVSLRVEAVTPFRKWTPEGGSDGRSRIFVDKDRHGAVRAASVRVAGDRDHFGDLTGRPHQDGRMSCRLWWPEPPADGGAVSKTPESTPEHYARMLIAAGLPEGYGRRKALEFIAGRKLSVPTRTATLNAIMTAVKTLREESPE